MDLPTLDALEREWATHPPVHHLVGAYLGYKAPPDVDHDDDDNTASAAEPANGASMAQMMGMGQGIPAPEAVRNATTTEESILAFERLFFGDVDHGQWLG